MHSSNIWHLSAKKEMCLGSAHGPFYRTGVEENHLRLKPSQCIANRVFMNQKKTQCLDQFLDW